MKMRAFLIVSTILLLSFTVFAQHDNSYQNNRSKQPKNTIKVNLTAAVLKNYSFQYERILGKKISFSIGYRTMPNSKLPMQKIGEKLIGNEEESLEKLKNFRLGNTAITTELRFYMNKKGFGKGFYLAPFYRKAIYKGSHLKFKYQNEAKVDTDILIYKVLSYLRLSV